MLGVEPEELSVQRWKSFAHHWRSNNEASTPTQAHCFHMNEVFANRSDEDEIYPLTTAEIAAAQRADASLKHLFKRNAVIDQGLEIKLIENATCVCKDGRLVIPKPLQVHAVKWYHHYLQHPGHTKDWRSNSLRTKLVSAKMVRWSSPSHSKCVQLSGTITTYSTPDTHVSRRR
jgi:hypothetical protein